MEVFPALRGQSAPSLSLQTEGAPEMGNKIVTEADRKATPQPKIMEGYAFKRNGGGQKLSLERGTWTRSKKNPGKRPHKGG
jgi:hypothetical protein